MFDLNHIPRKPFDNYKWQWASVQCTEGINDPVVLLGVLFRMAKLEGKGLRYSSAEFADQLCSLESDLNAAGVNVRVSSRGGERNIIRNSGQYWKALGLIPSQTHNGVIALTPFGRAVAERRVSQSEFAALTISTLTLPNPNIHSPEYCSLWKNCGLTIKPLRLILSVVNTLGQSGISDSLGSQARITSGELSKIVIPLAGESVSPRVIAKYLLAYREGRLDTSRWPNCCEGVNDHRMAREFLLFLSNYGYLIQSEGVGEEVFIRNDALKEEIAELVAPNNLIDGQEVEDVLSVLRSSDVISEVERKRFQTTQRRPNQARFRTAVLSACKRCVITNVTMPEVLEAAHIKPYKYNGEDTVANGFAMRTDIHVLFDTGHLRINTSGDVFVSERVRLDYGATIPPFIRIPDFINRDFIQWRWDNYDGM